MLVLPPEDERPSNRSLPMPDTADGDAINRCQVLCSYSYSQLTVLCIMPVIDSWYMFHTKMPFLYSYDDGRTSELLR